MKVLSSFKIDPDRLAILKAAQPEAEFVQVKEFNEPDSEVEVLVTFGGDINADTLALYPNVRWVQTLSAGVDKMPLRNLEEKKVMLTNTKGAGKIAMAEHVIWSILMLLRQGAVFVRQQDQKLFSDKPKLAELYGKTVCIIGAGTIGKEIARRCQAFGMTVYGISRRGRQDPDFKSVYMAEDMSKVLPISDIVVVVLPLTPATQNRVNTKFFEQMKNGALFINSARGPVVDEEALLAALKSKKISAAALDVFIHEPLPEDSPFWDIENVFITPHIGGRNSQTTQRMWDVFTANISVYPDRDKMVNIVDYAAGY